MEDAHRVTLEQVKYHLPKEERSGLPNEEPKVWAANANIAFEWGTFPGSDEGWAVVLTPVLNSGVHVGAGIITRPGPKPGHHVTFYYDGEKDSSLYFADDMPWDERIEETA